MDARVMGRMGGMIREKERYGREDWEKGKIDGKKQGGRETRNEEGGMEQNIWKEGEQE